MKVKNIQTSSFHVCKCGSWLNHWEFLSRCSATFCSEKNCIGNDLVGVHVQKVSSDTKWYIIPLCEKHSTSKIELEVVHNVIFVLADKTQTCEKEVPFIVR